MKRYTEGYSGTALQKRAEAKYFYGVPVCGFIPPLRQIFFPYILSLQTAV